MQGCRPLTSSEVDAMTAHLQGRDLLLFQFCLYTGFRIGEALSLKVQDVLNWDGSPRDRVLVRRGAMKGGAQSRSILIHPRVRALLEAGLKSAALESPLFQSHRTPGKPLERTMAWRLLRGAALKAGLTGQVATHSMRKTFADRMYAHFKGDIYKTAKAMGHKSVDSTAAYLSFRTQEIDEAVLGLAL